MGIPMSMITCEGFLLRIQTRRTLFFFSVTSLNFHMASPLPHLFCESSVFPSYSRRQLVHHHLGIFAKCRHCCPPTVPNSVQTIWPAQNGENIPGLIRARSHYRLSRQSNSNSIDPSTRVTLPQVFTWQKVGPLRRVTLPSRFGDPSP